MYFIEDEVTAWCFDRAVTIFGTSVEESIKAATAKSKTQAQADMSAQRTLRKWLNRSGDLTGLFRDPAAGR